MRTTRKRHPGPTCLAAAKRDAAITGFSWPPPGTCSDDIRAALVAKQQGLCAYCMQRIKPHGYRSDLHRNGGMKIEHWRDRAGNEARMYDWDNLLGVCGGEYRGASGLVEHCDTSRKNLPLTVNPGSNSPPRPEEVFSFKATPPDGGPTLRGVWIHAVAGHALDVERLNLNAEHLARNRQGAVDALRLALHNAGKRGGEPAVRQVLRRRLASSTRGTPATLPPFAPLIADYVRKKMLARGMQP